MIWLAPYEKERTITGWPQPQLAGASWEQIRELGKESEPCLRKNEKRANLNGAC
jgi:hypothetical protein